MNSEKSFTLDSKLAKSDSKASLKGASSAKAPGTLKKKIRKKKCIPRIVVRGQWSPEEDERLRQLVGKYGAQRWTELAQHFDGRRVGKQCRERWHNHLNPELRTADWMPAEEACVYAGWKYYGPQWAKIANHLCGRSDNRVKNHWNCHVKKFLNRASDKYDCEYEIRLQQIAEHYNFRQYFVGGEPVPAHILGVASPLSEKPPTMADAVLIEATSTEHARRIGKAGKSLFVQVNQRLPPGSMTKTGHELQPGTIAPRNTPNGVVKPDLSTAPDEVSLDSSGSNRRLLSSAASAAADSNLGKNFFNDNFKTPTKHCRSAAGLAVLRSSTAQRRLIPPTRLPTDTSATLQLQQKNQTPDMYEKYSRLQLRPGNYTFSPAEALQSPPKKRVPGSETPRHLHATINSTVNNTSGFPVNMVPPTMAPLAAPGPAKTLAALEVSKRQLFFDTREPKHPPDPAKGEKPAENAASNEYIESFLSTVEERVLHEDIALAMELVEGLSSADPTGFFNLSGSSSSGSSETRMAGGQQQREALFATPLPKLAGTSEHFSFYGQSGIASPPPTIQNPKIECATPDYSARRLVQSKQPAVYEPAYPPYVMQTPYYEFTSQYGPISQSFPAPTDSRNSGGNGSSTNSFATSSFMPFASNDMMMKHEFPTTPEKFRQTLALSSLYYSNNNNNSNNNLQLSAALPFGRGDDENQHDSLRDAVSPSFDDFIQSGGGVAGYATRTPDKAQIWAAVAQAAGTTGLTPVKLSAAVHRKRGIIVTEAAADEASSRKSSTYLSSNAGSVVKKLRLDGGG